MKEKSAADELTKLADSRKHEMSCLQKKKRSRNTTPKAQAEEGNQEQLSPGMEWLMRDIDVTEEGGEAAGEKVGDDKEKSSSDPKESDIDAEADRCSKENYDPRDRLIKRKIKKSADDDDEAYIPSPEHVKNVQIPPSSRGRKKSNARKRVVSPVVRKFKIKSKSKPASEPQQPPSEPQQPSSPPHQLTPKQPSPPHQPSPQHVQSPQSSPQLRIYTLIHEQPVITSQHVLQTPPTTQPPVQTTPGSSGFKDFPPIPENIPLEDIGDFNFVLVEKKKLEDRVKSVESENLSLLKKARRDEQNEYYKLKNKELEANNAKKEHEMYMMNRVLENLIGKSVEQIFEDIELEEVRARRKAEIEDEMKNKGKGVQIEGDTEITERAIVVSEPTIDPEMPIPNPCPISLVSGIFDDDVVDDYIEDDDEEDDEEEDDDDILKDDIDEYLHDDANEEPKNANSEGEHDDAKNVDENVDHVSKLILRLEHGVEEGEILHTYTLAEIIKMTHVDENEFKFDFE
ncbi:hypothetical protein Hanom_Chr02g00162981 [Helianthus anomalus]